MRFKLTANAYIKLPTVVDDGDTRYTKVMDTRITHPDGSQISQSSPLVIDFPSTLPLDSISRRWEALDDEAKAAQAKLPKATSDLAGFDSKFEPPKEAKADAASVLEALASLSDDEKAKLFAVLGGKKAEPKTQQSQPLDPGKAK